MFNYIFYKTRIHLIVNLLFRLRLPKVITILRNLSAYFFKSKTAGIVPSILTLQLTYKCNYTCIMCQKSSLDNNVYTCQMDDMDYEQLEKLLKASAEHISVLRITGGEPLMYPDFEKLIDLLNEIDLKYTILTNGYLLNESIIKKMLKNCLQISISIDSVYNDVYSYMRKGGDLNTVIHNIQTINSLKKSKHTPFLNIATTCFTFNIDGLYSIVEFCHKNNILSMSVSEGGYYNTPFIKDEHFIKNNRKQCELAVNKAQRVANELNIIIRWSSQVLYFSKEENKLISNRNKISSCVNFFFSGLLTPDFKFRICPHSAPVLDINGRSLKAIWNCDGMKSCREIILQNNFPNSCRYCNDYNNNFDKVQEYSYIDYQKQTKYWKIQ